MPPIAASTAPSRVVGTATQRTIQGQIDTPLARRPRFADLDTDLDSLEYHWYLGYLEWTEPKPPDFTGYQAIRLNACAFQSELNPPGSSHTLELIVSDGPIIFDREQGRTILGGYAYVSWTVRSQVACQ